MLLRSSSRPSACWCCLLVCTLRRVLGVINYWHDLYDLLCDCISSGLILLRVGQCFGHKVFLCILKVFFCLVNFAVTPGNYNLCVAAICSLCLGLQHVKPLLSWIQAGSIFKFTEQNALKSVSRLFFLSTKNKYWVWNNLIHFVVNTAKLWVPEHLNLLQVLYFKTLISHRLVILYIDHRHWGICWDLPVSVKDWMSYVRSMFTLSAFSTFLKMIPMNHMDTKSFLL